MTADVELLPLPEPGAGMPGQVAFIRSDRLLQEWCHANVLHHTSWLEGKVGALEANLASANNVIEIKAAEIEALRAKAEQLEEALRDAASDLDDGYHPATVAKNIRALLRDQEEGK